MTRRNRAGGTFIGVSLAVATALVGQFELALWLVAATLWYVTG